VKGESGAGGQIGRDGDAFKAPYANIPFTVIYGGFDMTLR